MEIQEKQDMANRLQAFHNGTEHRAWEWMGAHRVVKHGQEGVQFCLWAPHAADVSVIHEKNGWLRELSPMTRMAEDSAFWTCFLPDIERYDCYKYSIRTNDGQVFDKSDPFAFYAEVRPANASRYYPLNGYAWNDADWMKRRTLAPEPVNIYEVHLGSWQTKEDCSFFNYRVIADRLVPYLREMGYTHLELLPLMEHPYDGSWGYQPLGFFAATSRYGAPHDLMYLIDRCHQADIGVILDWTAAGFPTDAHGLFMFDGQPCYEACESDPKDMVYGVQKFDLGRGEVQSFLLSSAMFWITQFHADGLRVSSVQPMLYLDYQRTDGEWKANQFGENWNADGARFLRTLCDTVREQEPTVRMIASSTGRWSSVTKPTALGGLGFTAMWRDTWVQEALAHLEHADDPEALADWLSLSLLNSTGERFVLPLSHDAVSHGAGSLLARMPGEYHEKFAPLRLLYGFVMMHPGDKLLFMGCEFAQYTEWACHHALDWQDLDCEANRQMQTYVQALNRFYRDNPALWTGDSTEQIVWVDRGTDHAGLLALERRSPDGERLLAVMNLTAHKLSGCRLTLRDSEEWCETFCSDAIAYGGAGEAGTVTCRPQEDGTCRLTMQMPPFCIRFFEQKK